MSVPARRAVPSLLHVDSILHHLHGADAVGEVCRFLLAEFAHYQWIGVYRIEAGALVLDGQAGDPVDIPPTEAIGEGFFGTAAQEGRSRSRGPGTEVPSPTAAAAVPLRTAGVVEGIVAVIGRTPAALDASDLKFLEQIGARLAPEMALPRARLL
jgi:putative methionine-R-sulfoxide reductase with GAF domain